MADHGRQDADPAADPRTGYDYTADGSQRSGMVDDLAARIEGDVRFDEYSRQLYATDASAYEATPIGVVMPASTDDVRAVVEYCAEREIPVLPRGGGTSLAGQAVNEAVVLDFTKRMDAVGEIRPSERTARVQAGAVLAELNAELADHGLKFAPDPAAGDRSTIGGAIGNNSTGSHSLKYGKTDAYVEAVEAVLADGSVARFGEIGLDELRERADADGDLESRIYAAAARIVDEEAEAVDESFPQLKRNVSGYNLDRLVAEAREAQRGPESGSVNLARLLAGSEGTLALITEATVGLEPVPNTKSVALLLYRDLMDAVRDVDEIVTRHDPAAVEAVDDVLLDLARESEEFSAVASLLPTETEAALLVEFYADSDEGGRETVDALLADRVVGRSDRASDGGADPRAFDALEAHDPDERATLWKLRKSANPILLSRTSDEKHISFIEDTAVPTDQLASFIAGFQDVLADHDTFASFYGHAGPGCMHVRPLVSTKTVDGVERIESISDAVTDLVIEHEGSVSGEHGDGRARTQWNRKLYGDRLWNVFRDLKTAFDPDWILNPGQVCGDAKMTENLRFDPEYSFDSSVTPALNWENDNGFQGMVELCHGCGGCRGGQATRGGVMCPTYRAANEEITSTRGRANMLRQAMSGDLEGDELDVEFMSEVVDLCIGCKGCARDCPSEVDMAKLKAEIEHEHHRRHGASVRERLFANVDLASAVGSALAPLSNYVHRVPGVRAVMDRTLGIARERSLPTFRRESFVDWFEARGSRISATDADRKAVLFPDTHTNYSRPEAGKAAVRVLEAAGVHVALPEGVTSSGRAAHSKGFLGEARDRARTNVDALSPLLDDGWDVVVVEPSDAVMLQSDYRDLLAGEDVAAVAAGTYGVCEYLDAHDFDLPLEAPDESLTYHGHCHQKATTKDGHAANVLRDVGYRVDALDSGCCGMAGSFGYESEHYSMSEAIGRILFEQVDSSPGETIVAPGASCRMQLGDRNADASQPPHPIEKVADALP